MVDVRTAEDSLGGKVMTDKLTLTKYQIEAGFENLREYLVEQGRSDLWIDMAKRYALAGLAVQLGDKDMKNKDFMNGLFFGLMLGAALGMLGAALGMFAMWALSP